MIPISLAFAIVLIAQLPPVAVQPAAPRGRVEGVVLRAGTNEPVVGAKVTLSRPGETNVNTNTSATGAGNSINLFPVPPVPTGTGTATAAQAALNMPPLPIPPVTSDEGGKFAFRDVEAGTYRLFVHLDGYVRQEYGQRVFPGQGASLTLSAGEVLKDLNIQLMPAGNITGRIVDNLGKPAVGVQLQLMKAVYNQIGVRTFQFVGNTRTNDRGEYRLYWVTPGRYYLAGGTQQGPAGSGGFGPSTSQNEAGDSYTFTYYPGVTDSNRATALDVRPGGEVLADFIVPKQQLYTIRGRVVDPASAIPPPSASIALAYQALNGQNSMFSRNPLYSAATGMFELRDVVPGPYLLYVNTANGAGREPVDVVNANIEGLVVTVNSGVNIAGRISVEGGTVPSVGVRIQLRPMAGGSPTWIGNLPNTNQIQPDGSFTLNNVLPGQYRIAPPSVPELYVKQLRFDRFDALNQPVDVVQRGPDPPTLDIVLSPNVSQIEGIVTDAKMQPVGGVQAVLIPDSNRDRLDLYKTATTDQAGRFKITSVAPGEFKIFSWETLDGNQYFDPDFLRRSEAAGKPVRVTESSKQSVTLQVIPLN